VDLGELVRFRGAAFSGSGEVAIQSSQVFFHQINSEKKYASNIIGLTRKLAVKAAENLLQPSVRMVEVVVLTVGAGGE